MDPDAVLQVPATLDKTSKIRKAVAEKQPQYLCEVAISTQHPRVVGAFSEIVWRQPKDTQKNKIVAADVLPV